MWDGCTPVLGAEPDPPRREITGWQIPGIGEMDIESEGYRMSVLPADGTLRVELAFSGAYAESETTPYRQLGPMVLSLDGVLSLGLDTPGAPADPLWKRVLRGDSQDELLRMAWDEKGDVLHVRDGGTTLSFRGGTWRWGAAG
ncbi:hypothetical protein [Streptomyces sp. NPDC048349]|uniref:hypothetical protein n=1 Tax=Streptomyces sp. NPDC048349 TaxID=3155486 RepID=UPI00342A1501